MSDTGKAPEIVQITINGVQHDAVAGERVIIAAEKVGEYIPRFCHHPKLDPVAKCRQCLVEVEGPRGKQLQPSCAIYVTDGMVIDTQSDVVKKAQEGVIEYLLINHPLDCPVCDKAGECPLQDQTMSHGPGESRFVEAKRTYEKPIPVSDLVLLDRERCILCDRCVRVADQIAGDPLITFNQRGNHTQILTFPNEPFSSYFSGNTVQVCPVGALTSTDYRFRARPYDLEITPTVSLRDTVHSNAEIHASRGKVLRVYGAMNDHVNDGWLSDRDRFSFGAMNSPRRVTTPLQRTATGLEEMTWADAIKTVATRLGAVKGTEVGAIGGANGTNEEAYALSKFMRTVVGSPHLDAQLGDGFAAQLAVAVTPRATIDDLETATTILLWGPDLKERLPVLYLRVRKAVRNGTKLVVVAPAPTGLDSIATHVVRYRAGSGQDVIRKLTSADKSMTDVLETLALGPVVTLFGRTSIAEDPRLAESIAAYGRTLSDAKLMPLLQRGNVFGALDMGLAPDLLPGRVAVSDTGARSAIEQAWGPLPEVEGRDTAAMLSGAVSGEIKALILVGADPVRDTPDPKAAQAGLEATEFVVAIDAFVTDSTRHADIILPAALWGELEGTVTNLEGRVQTLSAAVHPRGQARSTTAMLNDIANAMGASLTSFDVSVVSKEIASVAPAYEGIDRDSIVFTSAGSGIVIPTSEAKIIIGIAPRYGSMAFDAVSTTASGSDVIVPVEGTQPLSYLPTDQAVPMITDRYTLHFAPAMYDDGVITRHTPSIAHLGKDAAATLNPRDAASLAVTEGAMVVVNGQVTLPVHLDGAIPEGSVVLPFNHVATKGLPAVPAVSLEPVRDES